MIRSYPYKDNIYIRNCTTDTVEFLFFIGKAKNTPCFRGKILLLYKNFKNRYEGWVLPKGTVESGEKHVETALREVFEESGVKATVMKYIGKSEYSFNVPQDVVEKEVHWYLMMADNYYSKPQREEFFVDSGYYKYHEAYHLLKFSNEKQILEQAYQEYLDLRKNKLWIKPR